MAHLPARSRGPLALTLIAAALCGSALGAQAGRTGTVAELLASPPETAEQVLELTDGLIAIGSPAIPDLLAALGTGELDLLQVGGVLDAFARYSPTAVRSHLTALQRAGLERGGLTDGERLGALLVYGAVGGGEDLRGMVASAAPIDPRKPIAREVQLAFSAALEQTFLRDRETIVHVAPAFNLAHPSLKARLIAGVRGAGLEDGLSVLGRLLGEAPELDLLTLAAIGDLARRSGERIDAELLKSVRSYLSQRDERLVQSAALALAELRDPRAVSDLIGLLDSADANLAATADRALTRIAGRDFHGDQQRWRRWYQEEQDWWRGAEEAVLSDLRSGMTARMARAINEVAAHRLFRRELELSLVEQLNLADPDLVAMACGALGRLGSRAGVRQLASLSDHPDERIASAARNARQQIFGRPLTGASGAAPQ